MNLLALVQRLHRESGLGEAPPVSLASASTFQRRLFDWVSDAWMQLQSRNVEWAWMLKEGAGPTTTVDMAYTGSILGLSDVGRWRTWRDGTYTVRAYLPADPAQVWNLSYMPYDNFRATYLDSDNGLTGQPSDWAVAPNGRLMIGPMPDDVYQLKVDYLSEPYALDEETDSPDMPARHHLILMWRALVEVGTYYNAADVVGRASKNFALMEQALLADQAPQLSFGGPLA